MASFLFQIFQMLAQDSLTRHKNTLPKDFLFAEMLHFRKSEESHDRNHFLDAQSSAMGNHLSDRFDKQVENGLELHQHP
jgi:hypothetical protein